MSTKKSPAKSPFDLSATDTKHLKNLVKLMADTELSEIEMERDGVRIRLRKDAIASAPAVVATAVPESKPASAMQKEALKSPLVGTFYHASSPDAEPFVSIGSKVKKGQTVGIIEAMKTMNPVEADKNGVVKEILIPNATPVEFGQGLMVIE